MSQVIRKRIEQGSGLVKAIGGLDKSPITTLPRVHGGVTFSFAAYNLIRIGGIAEW